MASIKCGACKGTHDSVQSVRNCYDSKNAGNDVEAIQRRHERQALTPLDRIRAASAKLPDVDRMRYAIVRDNTVEGTRFNFYQVDRPQTGKWRGYTFVKQMLSEELVRVSSMGASAEILEQIAQDPQKAASDFGLQTEKCGHCHRRLTRDDSRQRGYGPDCAAKLGMDF